MYLNYIQNIIINISVSLCICAQSPKEKKKNYKCEYKVTKCLNSVKENQYSESSLAHHFSGKMNLKNVLIKVFID